MSAALCLPRNQHFEVRRVPVLRRPPLYCAELCSGIAMPCVRISPECPEMRVALLSRTTPSVTKHLLSKRQAIGPIARHSCRAWLADGAVPNVATGTPPRIRQSCERHARKRNKRSRMAHVASFGSCDEDDANLKCVLPLV